MIDTGIIRCVDNLGRIVIPMELRRTFDIKENDAMEFFIENNKDIMIRKYERGCAFCGEINQVIKFKGKLICKGCIEEL